MRTMAVRVPIIECSQFESTTEMNEWAGKDIIEYTWRPFPDELAKNALDNVVSFEL